MDVISIIMAAGKSSVDVALYTLLPIMVIMLIIMKYLEVRGILDVIVRWVAPLLKPFGLTGMSAFALIQINFVSFAAPLATLSIMDKRGVSDRQMAATLAMVFAMGQGNVFYPSPLLVCTGWPRSLSRWSAACARRRSPGTSPDGAYRSPRIPARKRCPTPSRTARAFWR
jgi:spore maturation protein SpmB